MSDEIQKVVKMIENPKNWEEAETILFNLIKDTDEGTDSSAKLILKDLQRKKFNNFLSKFESPITNNEDTIQRTVSRTLSMIIPRGLKHDFNDSESESDNDLDKSNPKLPYTQIKETQEPLLSPPNRPLPDKPVVPPKPKKDLPQIPKKSIPTVPPKDFHKSNINLQVDIKPVDFDTLETPNNYYPSLEELDSQFSKIDIPAHLPPSGKLPDVPKITKYNKVPVNNPYTLPNQKPLPESFPQPASLYQKPEYEQDTQKSQPQQDQEYKHKMLHSYLSMQREFAQDQYCMETPVETIALKQDNTSPNIEVHSSVSNKPPNTFYSPVDQTISAENTQPRTSQQFTNPPTDRNTASQNNATTALLSKFPHSGLNTVYLPKLLIAEFSKIAQLNTSRNIETCGLLAGKYRKIKRSSIKQQAAYLVTHLIIPKQSGTSDSCVMEGEELVANFQIDNDLLTLGWIHTHPTQTCFLSSLDLHTHFPFQLTLPESIAIVCAPTRNPNYGIFRLVHPEGVEFISECRDTKLFHLHDCDFDLYHDVLTNTQHVRFVDKPTTIEDLRGK
eukprot:NODE_929_length_3026_cov_0.256577.p1 type:complete len:558 gc:universal NODE_929_length_3026_cov_0.256577:2836-1163(-)